LLLSLVVVVVKDERYNGAERSQMMVEMRVKRIRTNEMMRKDVVV